MLFSIVLFSLIVGFQFLPAFFYVNSTRSKGSVAIILSYFSCFLRQFLFCSLSSSVMATLTASQKELLEAIDKGDTAKAVKLLDDGVSVNCTDACGMTPLSSAAYRGNIEVAKKCVERGADVNSKEHDHRYTPLMFAALSGKPDLCRFLMDSGAYASATNDIGKTACEMAAFVGQHECVSIINNHIGIEEVDKFLHPKGKESEELFPEQLAAFIHKLTSSHVVHPVAILLKFIEYDDALKYRKKILYVVDRVFEKQLRSKESNEVMSLKLWIILYVLRDAYKHLDERQDKDPKDTLNLYIKYLLNMDPSDQVRPRLDTLLRGSIVAFPYHQSLLFETLLKALAKSRVGERPSAYDFILQGLFGHRLHAVSKFCATCGAIAAKKRCPQCRLVYCSQSCQKLDWPIHKKCCKTIATWNEGDVEKMTTLSIDDIQPVVEEESKENEEVSKQEAGESGGESRGDGEVQA